MHDQIIRFAKFIKFLMIEHVFPATKKTAIGFVNLLKFLATVFLDILKFICSITIVPVFRKLKDIAGISPWHRRAVFVGSFQCFLAICNQINVYNLKGLDIEKMKLDESYEYYTIGQNQLHLTNLVINTGCLSSLFIALVQMITQFEKEHKTSSKMYMYVFLTMRVVVLYIWWFQCYKDSKYIFN